MGLRSVILLGRFGATLAATILFVQAGGDLVVGPTTGERLTADVYYLPLQEIIPPGEQREAVEQSIIDTSYSLNRRPDVAEFILHAIPLAGAILACIALWRVKLPAVSDSEKRFFK